MLYESTNKCDMLDLSESVWETKRSSERLE